MRAGAHNTHTHRTTGSGRRDHGAAKAAAARTSCRLFRWPGGPRSPSVRPRGRRQRRHWWCSYRRRAERPERWRAELKQGGGGGQNRTTAVGGGGGDKQPRRCHLVHTAAARHTLVLWLELDDGRAGACLPGAACGREQHDCCHQELDGLDRSSHAVHCWVVKERGRSSSRGIKPTPGAFWQPWRPIRGCITIYAATTPCPLPVWSMRLQCWWCCCWLPHQQLAATPCR